MVDFIKVGFDANGIFIACSIKLFIICWVFNGSNVSLKKFSFHPCLHGWVKAVDLNGESIVVVRINWLCFAG